MTTARPSDDGTVPAKGTLFCPECGHQSRYDGNWRVVETLSECNYRCPDCLTKIATRPRHDGTVWQPDPFYESVWQTWEAGFKVWQGVWQESLSFP